MRVVLDTDVLVSMVYRREREVMNALYKALRKDVFTIIFCKETYNELKEVLSRDKFRHVKRTIVKGYLLFLSEKATWIEPRRNGAEAIDPDDQMLIDLAVSSNCRYLVTGNLKDMPKERSVGLLEIVSPREFVDKERLA